MSYNIEDQEDYLKNEMPFRMNEEQWQSMQQRIKDKVIGENALPVIKKKKTFHLKAAIGIAAGAALLISLMFPYSKLPLNNNTSFAGNAEQKLDKTIGSLNEDELHWIQQLNENEIPEQDQYLENEVDL